MKSKHKASNEDASQASPKQHAIRCFKADIRHLQWGWWGLLVFLSLNHPGGAHGFKVGAYLDVDNKTLGSCGLSPMRTAPYISHAMAFALYFLIFSPSQRKRHEWLSDRSFHSHAWQVLPRRLGDLWRGSRARNLPLAHRSLSAVHGRLRRRQRIGQGISLRSGCLVQP